MDIKKYIDRPLLSIVINVMVVAVGIIALTRLPIEKFPDIAPPTVYLWASYPGASAETVQKSVVAPLEQAINGVDNMMYMTSSASNGSASISIFFKQGTNADMAAVNVQNRVVQAQAQLPAEVPTCAPPSCASRAWASARCGADSMPCASGCGPRRWHATASCPATSPLFWKSRT